MVPRHVKHTVRRGLVIALSLAAVATVVTSAPPDRVHADGTPPACPFVNDSQRQCSRYLATGSLGSIGLVGDSVLLGSADGWSSPGLPRMLSDAGWGPINLVATLGMRTRSTNANISGIYWVKRWHDSGFHPDVIAVNLGANHLGSWNAPLCTPTNTTACATQIKYMIDTVTAYHPKARIWWAKVNHEPFGKGNGYSLGMLGWNKALDQAAAANPKLVLWDWPSDLLSANPAIVMDAARVHPVSGGEYVKRSRLMLSHINLMMPWAKYVGPRRALPTAGGSGVTYSPSPTEVTIYDTRLSTRLAAGETRDIDLSDVAAVDSAAGALAITLTAIQPDAQGYLTIFRCGDAIPSTSNLNFAAGVDRTGQAISRITDTEHVCLYASTGVHVVMDIQGNFAPGGTTFTPITPQRPLDTRRTGRAVDLVVDVPDATAVAITITAVRMTAAGTLTVYNCDQAIPAVAHVRFLPNEIVAGAAFVPVSAAGTICVHVGTGATPLTDVIVDVTGTFRPGPGLVFVPVTGTRLLDTRSGIGGWAGRHGTGQTLDVPVAPAGAQAVTATVTVVRPALNNFLTVHPCGIPVPPTSSVNATAGAVMANSVTIGIDSTQRAVCIYSAWSTHTLLDLVGWWVPAPSA